MRATAKLQVLMHRDIMAVIDHLINKQIFFIFIYVLFQYITIFHTPYNRVSVFLDAKGKRAEYLSGQHKLVFAWDSGMIAIPYSH